MQLRLIALMLVVSLTVSAQDTLFNKSDLKSVAKIFDLSFTEKEIDTLYSDVKDN
ncbi:MAG: hypothetical protein RL034_1458, partial [Bacteroidota bacterium]